MVLVIARDGFLLDSYPCYIDGESLQFLLSLSCVFLLAEVTLRGDEQREKLHGRRGGKGKGFFPRYTV